MSTKTKPHTVSANLAYNDIASGGTSDKVYQVQLEPVQHGEDFRYAVNFQFGRRGGTLQTGTKTPEPVAYDQAKSIYLKLLEDKTSKGYRANGETAHPGPVGATGPARTEWPVELLTEITSAEAGRFIRDPEYLLQEKVDGHRRQILKKAKTIWSFNKKGEAVALPESTAAAVREIPMETVLLDGELIGDRFVAFDLIHCGDGELKPSYGMRFTHLLELIPRKDSLLSIVRTFRTASPAARLAWIERLHKERAEGVVFKNAAASYRPGRSDQHKKLKFVKTCSAVVMAVGTNGKASIDVGLYANGQVIEIGTCSTMGKKIPKVGQVVEVRYLYASAGRKLQQAIYLGWRDDIDANECTMDQLHFKQGEAPEERS